MDKEERMTLDLWAFRSGIVGAGVDLRGMGVHALDGGIGKVQDVVERGSRTFLLVDTGPWIFGKTIKLPAGLVSSIDVEEGIVSVARSKDEVKSAPEHDDDLGDTAHEDALARHYAVGRGDAAAVGAPAEPSGTTEPAAIPSDRPAAVGASSPVDAAPNVAGPEGARDEEAGSAPPSREREVGDRRSAAGGDAEVAVGTTPPARAGGGGQLPSAQPGPDPGSASEGSEQRAGEHEKGADGDAPGLAVEAKAKKPATDGTATSPSRPASAERSPREERGSSPSSEKPEEPKREPPRPGASEQPVEASPAATERRPARPRAEAPTSTTAADTPPRKRVPAPGTDASAATARRRRETRSRDESAPKPAPSKPPRAAKARNEPPLPRYDSLTAADVVARLRTLSQNELARVERYERGGDGRQTILKRVAALREKEPWRGYDTATVKDVKEKLARAKTERVTAVRDYERRHRNRTGVMDAARRRLDSM
jgi:hypothetical protein